MPNIINNIVYSAAHEFVAKRKVKTNHHIRCKLMKIISQSYQVAVNLHPYNHMVERLQKRADEIGMMKDLSPLKALEE